MIVGRANVGKSSLFNRLIKKRKALVFDEAGVTRDLLKEKASWWSEDFEVIDSGGWQDSKEEIVLKIKDKIEEAFLESDVLVLVLDAKTGPLKEDFEVLERVRKTKKPYLLFVNKVDSLEKKEELCLPFYEMEKEFLSGSLEQDFGTSEVVDWILEQKKVLKKDLEIGEKKGTRLFVLGKANSGKSLLCNQILGKERMIVSSISGTTLDTVTDSFSYKEEDYMISDNPGSRRGNREDKEKLSFAKSRSELEQADIALLVMDAEVGPSRQDTRLVSYCLENNKPLVLVVNKMDLLKDLPSEEKKLKREEIERAFHFFPDLPTVFLSAKTGWHKDQLFSILEDIKRKINFRISTSKLNDFFTKVIKKAPSPVYGTSDVKFYYINQTNNKPPEFIAFSNYPKGVTPAYERFVVNQIKKNWNLEGIPVRFHAIKKR